MIDRKTPVDDLPEQLSETERAELRVALEQAILGAAGSSPGLEQESAAYLRLVQRTDLASRECSALLVDAVRQATRAGNSWAAVGAVLGISRQAAQQRFGAPRASAQMEIPGKRRVITGATAFNEMKMLEIEGAAGNHLVDFGPLYLIVEESDHPWQHLRHFGWQQQARLVAEGWTLVGAWFPFRYYKRPQYSDD